MTLTEFCEKFDNGDWTPLHYAFLDEVRPDVLRSAWQESVEYAMQLAMALELPADMLHAALPEMPKQSYFSTRAVVFALLRARGIHPETLPAEEGVLLLK